MNFYRITFKIDNWTYQPIRAWAKNEQDAIDQGIQTLILAGHKMYEFESLHKIGG